MKKSALFFLALSTFFLLTNRAEAGLGPWYSLSRITLDMTLAYGGFSLQGNDGTLELKGVSPRKANKVKSDLYGVGGTISYKISEAVEIFYNPHYEYGNEPLVETSALIVKDFGVKYRFLNRSRLYPFAKMSYTSYVLDGLKVFDYTITQHSVSTIREYDFEGSGMSLGFGVDWQISQTLAYTLDYNVTATTSFDKKEGGIDFENSPKTSRFAFSVRITL